MTNPVEIVTITAKSPLFKKGTGEPATSIELINFSFSNGDECGFNVVSQKNLYSIGDSAIYIQPDYCIPETELFSSFHVPYGDPNKSKLGKNGRIRAIKFNFSLKDSSDIIYSNGILLPLSEANIPDNTEDLSPKVGSLAEFLGITKYEEPERFGNGDAKGGFPGFLYKTDEENAANLKSYINRILEAGERIGWTLKIDGSSFTQYFKKGVDGWYTGICSRTMEKKIPDDISLTSDRWVNMSISSGLYERGMQYCQENDRELAFRGEIYGEGVTKGSGNKSNPHSKEKPNLAIFGIDDLSSGYATKLLHPEVECICHFANIPHLGIIEVCPKDYNELVDMTNEIFESYKRDKGWTVEGLVVRTLDSNNLSCKIMNNFYDSRK
jgi:hypothetical protein